jgi:protease-4
MAKFPHIISAIARGQWLIDFQEARAYMPIALRILNGEKAFEDSDEEEKPVAPLIFFKDTAGNMAQMSANIDNSANIYDGAPKGSIAVIPFKGPVMKEDNCGTPGTATLASWIKQADSSENIQAIIIDTDGPGGNVHGTFEFSDIVKNTQTPVVAYIDGLAASATYGGIVGANHIMASHDIARIGSIGTMITLFNWEEYDKKLGVKEIVINADGSPDKNKSYYEALAGNDKLIKQETLNPLNEIFHRTVTQGREGKLQIDAKTNEPLTGKVYLAQDAIKMGLIDSIGTFEEAIKKAYELAQSESGKQSESESGSGRKQQSNQSNLNNNMKKQLLSAWTVACAVFGVSFGAGETSKEVEISDEQFKQLAEKAEGLNSSLNTANENITALKAELDSFKTKLEASEKENVELKKLPGVIASMPEKKGTDVVETQKDDAFETSYDLEKKRLKAQGLI